MIAIIGTGIIGAATSREFSKRKKSVLLVESRQNISEGVTSRNSGVIHSGVYYSPSSLKARTCVEGNRLLYEWCELHKVLFRKTGKLIVRKEPDEEKALHSLFENALASGAPGVRMVSKQEIRKLEPELDAVEAIFCPETGIVDPVTLTESLVNVAKEEGAEVALSTTVEAIDRLPTGGYRIYTNRGEMDADVVINAGGLYSDEIAAMVGIDQYRIHPCRGDYFHLKTRKKYRHLIYPIKKKKDVGLGVHLTIGLDGQYRLGPDSEYVDRKDDFSPREDKLDLFHEAAQRLLGPIDQKDLSYDTVGIRPKLRGPNDPEDKDFVISQDLPGFINLVGIDSPGLTAALAIGRKVREILFS